MALDILPQLSILRGWLFDCSVGNQTTRDEGSTEGTIIVRGLDGRVSFRLKHVQLLDRCNLGWFSISMEELADTHSNRCRFRWGCGNSTVGTLRSV